MSEPKTRCPDCGAFILQRTADKYGGICGKCHHKAALIPPDDFQIPPDLAQRLIAIDEDPMDYREMAWKDEIQFGPEFVHGVIGQLEARNALHRKWSPRLREFTKKCREVNPPPPDNALSRRDRAIQQICEAKIAAGYLPLRRNTVTVCCLPLIAIPIAQRLWPGEDDRAVLLTSEEESRWDEVYSHPKGAIWWFERYWWSVDDSPQKLSIGDFTIVDWDDNDVPQGHSPWLVTSGCKWGPLHGGSETELWTWDGTHPRFIKSIGRIQY